MSCIYGPHQHGNEDQGWVAHLLRAAIRGDTITIYGDGRQVRDVLFVDDLVDAFLLARARIRELAGEAFNVGGGPANTLSLLELVELIASLEGARPRLEFSRWRAADQRWYVSDTRKLSAATSWAPSIGVAEGVRRLHAWLRRAERGAEVRAAAAGAPL
jgi:CDP-paratose 2-epimerase